MKAMNRILFIVCCLWACYSCRGKMPDTEFVLHLPADYSFDISLELADTIVGMDMDDEKKAIALLPLEKSGYGRLWVGDRRFPVWLEAGKPLRATLELNVLHFEGAGAKTNDYLNRKFYHTPCFRDYGMDDAAFREKLEKMVRERVAALDTAGLDAAFVALEKKRIAHDRIYELAANIVYGGTGDKTISGETFMELQGGLTEDESSWGIPEYPESFQKVACALARMDETSVSPYTMLLNVLKIATGECHDPRLVEYIVARSSLEFVRSPGMEGTEEMDRIFRERVKRQDYLEEYQHYRDENNRLAKGQPAVPFTFQDVDGKEVSLSDLKGKYVYIDVWATWCGPCKMEIPYLKKLEEKLHGRNIYFVSISCDEGKAGWLKFVKDEKLGGIQLNTGGDQSFMQAILCHGIPRFLLIDKDGNYINANMSRPSEPETLKILESLPGL